MTVLLLRHGRLTANVVGILIGRLLNIRHVNILRAVIGYSPLKCCVTITRLVILNRNHSIIIDLQLTEVDYGRWLVAMSDRVVRERDYEITNSYDHDAIWLVCIHSDIIKAIIADTVDMHGDLFQGIMLSSASLIIIRYFDLHASVACINNASGQISVKVTGKRTRSIVDGDIGTEEHSRRMT